MRNLKVFNILKQSLAMFVIAVVLFILEILWLKFMGGI